MCACVCLCEDVGSVRKTYDDQGSMKLSWWRSKSSKDDSSDSFKSFFYTGSYQSFPFLQSSYIPIITISIDITILTLAYSLISQRVEFTTSQKYIVTFRFVFVSQGCALVNLARICELGKIFENTFGAQMYIFTEHQKN